MDKNNRHLIMFFLLVISLIVLASCSKAECKTSADCPVRACSQPKCGEGKCIYTQQINCCGNNLQEAFEDGKPGDKCTCPQDFGKCEGIPKVKMSGRDFDATYAKYYCNQYNRCVLGVESKDASAQTFLDAIGAEYFEASSVVKYNKPFDMKRDSFELKVTIDDANENLVTPVQFTGVKLLYTGITSRSEQLIAEKELDSKISKIGDSITISVPLNMGYKPEEVEEAGSVRYTLDYSYKKKVVAGRTPEGSPVYQEEFARDKYNSPSKQVFLVRSE